MLAADHARGRFPRDDRVQSPDDTTLGMVHDAEMLTEAVVNTLLEPLLLLDVPLIVRLANRSFYRMFQVRPQDTLGRLVYEIGSRQWDVPDLPPVARGSSTK